MSMRCIDKNTLPFTNTDQYQPVLQPDDDGALCRFPNLYNSDNYPCRIVPLCPLPLKSLLLILAMTLCIGLHWKEEITSYSLSTGTNGDITTTVATISLRPRPVAETTTTSTTSTTSLKPADDNNSKRNKRKKEDTVDPTPSRYPQPLTELATMSDGKVVGDVSDILDFAIIG